MGMLPAAVLGGYAFSCGAGGEAKHKRQHVRLAGPTRSAAELTVHCSSVSAVVL